MIDQQGVNSAVVEGLERATGRPVVKQNSAGPRPELPFLTFTVTSPRLPVRGTAEDWGKEYRRAVGQMWSVTAHGAQDSQALALALQAADWLEQSGRRWLEDREIVVVRVGGVSNRDTLLGAGYEYRYGFDLTLTLENVIPKSPEELGEIIELAQVARE